jgi:AcrR family transcriptional regulator
MPRTEEAYRQIRDERKAQILEAALGVFAREGLAATKIADIAMAAGTSHGLVYHYFGSKEEIFAVLVERALTGTMQIVRSALERPGDVWERMRWMTAQLLSDRPGRLEYAMLVLQTLTSEAMPAEVREMAWRQAQAIRDGIRQLIVAGQEEGTVVMSDPDQLVILYLSCIQGLSIETAFLGSLMPSFPDVDLVLRMLKA